MGALHAVRLTAKLVSEVTCTWCFDCPYACEMGILGRHLSEYDLAPSHPDRPDGLVFRFFVCFVCLITTCGWAG